MPDRRKFLIAGAAAVGAFSLRGISEAYAKTLGNVSPVGFKVPPGVVDCHCHIFDPARFPYSPRRHYTPPPATVSDLEQFHAAIGIQRTVLVQPSVYGTDNACLLDSLKQLGDSARGMAVIDRSFSAQQIDDLIGAGGRGVRVNLEVGKDRNVDDAYRRLMDTVDALHGRPAIIQIFAALNVIDALAPRIQAQPHPIVLDHFGLAKAAKGPEQEGFSALTGLMASGKVYVKLSGPYYISEQGRGYTDAGIIAGTLVSAAPDQVVWGSNWPHTGGTRRPDNAKPTDIEPFRNEDEGQNLSLVKQWAPSQPVRQELLVDNAAKLFGFSSARSV
ncbi:amidohydrolase family protein [Paraburkholderia sp. Tr-20389]|uniref:amidohydrolase family protein n=1 Tax=Paraburkholderia sp. Tr-20389 TaxID=2703903 RepID=UPI00197F1BFB|nr:amidohydrolase family protein [Paraburkholderia sp. Tr-20389]MBN3754800.1 amidohydrolase family protein [Paraburkholderia sp. Tr-20389]